MAKIEIRKKDILPLAAFAIMLTLGILLIGGNGYEIVKQMCGAINRDGALYFAWCALGGPILLLIENRLSEEHCCLCSLAMLGTFIAWPILGFCVFHSLGIEMRNKPAATPPNPQIVNRQL